MRLALPSRTALAGGILLAAYFIWFVIDGTRVGWTNDDPMNLYMYWKPGLAKVIESNFVFWNGFYRPLGGLFYLPIYAVAHLNPTPYRYVMCALLGVNTLLVYIFSKHLNISARGAWLARSSRHRNRARRPAPACVSRGDSFRSGHRLLPGAFDERWREVRGG